MNPLITNHYPFIFLSSPLGDSLVEWWARYHASLGFNHIFIFVDQRNGIADSDRLASALTDLDTIVHVLPSAGLPMGEGGGKGDGEGEVEGTVVDMQMVNVATAIDAAREVGCEWLVHIDDDEVG